MCISWINRRKREQHRKYNMENTAACRWHKIRKGQGKVSETNKKTTVMYGHRLKKGIFLV